MVGWLRLSYFDLKKSARWSAVGWFWAGRMAWTPWA